MYTLIKLTSHCLIVRREEVYKVLSLREHACRLLALDGIAKALGWLYDLARLRLPGRVNIKVRHVAQQRVILVAKETICVLGGEYLPIAEESNVSLIPLSRTSRVMHL
jgi:hypothetical protein